MPLRRRTINRWLSTPPSGTVRPDGGASRLPGDGNVATATISAMKLTATFKQTRCGCDGRDRGDRLPAGHPPKIQVHEGSLVTIPPRPSGMANAATASESQQHHTCDASQSASVTYNAFSSDPAAQLDVGDHNAMTDVTRHPSSPTTNAEPSFEVFNDPICSSSYRFGRRPRGVLALVSAGCVGEIVDQNGAAHPPRAPDPVARRHLERRRSSADRASRGTGTSLLEHRFWRRPGSGG